jgi:hypothetical protein
MTASEYEILLSRRYTTCAQKIARKLGIKTAGVGRAALISTVAGELATGQYPEIVAYYRLG